MRIFARFLVFFTSLGLLGAATAALGTVVAYFYYAPVLPPVDTLKDVRLQVPLRIYTRDGRLVAQFGDKRRLPVTWEELPERLIQAYISSEDDRFFEHPGVDYQGLLRAGFNLIKHGRIHGGGSTITMQAARAFFLTPDQSFSRKIQEIFLALKMEREFDKQEILTLYLNKIFLGQRAYGVGAAAQVYYGKRLHELSLGQMATLAGLPQRPSVDNPVRSPERAMGRRQYVLRRMFETGAISRAEYDEALTEPIETTVHGTEIEVSAPYVAEMVRVEVERQFGRDALNQGLEVITTIDSRLQRAAQSAVRRGLFEYDRRHGFRGALESLTLEDYLTREDLLVKLSSYPVRIGLTPAVVLSVDDNTATLLTAADEQWSLDLAAVAWARRFLDQETVGDEVQTVSEVLDTGNLVYLTRDDQGQVQLSQMPVVQGAMVALDPLDGAISSLVGGLDFNQNKFNRVLQARRQPGSSFKPFVYSAALELGLTPATIINDAPVVFADAALEDVWRPKNYSGRVFGDTRLREALIKSRNLVSIRVLDRVGIRPTIEHLVKFGFDREDLPRDLSLALGSAAVTPLELAEAYATFANGGFDVNPYFIDRIYDAQGTELYRSAPALACHDCVDPQTTISETTLQESSTAVFDGEDAGCERIIASYLNVGHAERAVSAQNAHLITSMMRDVIRRGTGVRANRLGRRDLAGKTGTTNDNRDAWFSGFNSSLVAISWIGFDQERPLGRGEVGGTAALPVWVYFMENALDGVPESIIPEPDGLVTVLISPDSGLLSSAGRADAIFETFRIGMVPKPEIDDEHYFIDPFADPAAAEKTVEKDEELF
ncbi:MAG: penicillin-binding protein 1A [Gammaproteobacteria bacterium]|nr:penicillin-binding protein 1A [Gammaproteobacteria bacterium]